MGGKKVIECVFYSHVWSIYELEKLGFLTFEDALIVELAAESRFAPVFDKTDKSHKGIVALLQPGVHLHKLAIRQPGIKAPVILAPNPPVPIDIQLSAVSLLPSVESSVEKMILMIHVNDAAQFAGAYAVSDTFSIVWDVADYPGAELSELGRTLLNRQCLNRETWKGFFLCNHPHRHLPDIALRESILRALLKEFPTLEAA